MKRSTIQCLATAAAFAFAATLPAAVQEDFSTDPLARGWRVFGDANLFQWNSTNGTLEVTWDSSRPNSYWHQPLGIVLRRDDDFTLSFDLRVDEIGVGLNNKSFAFPIVVGFVNFNQATSANFKRGTGADSPNLVEFDYFRNSGFGATVWPLFVDTNSQFNFNGASDYTVAELSLGVWHRVKMEYKASLQTLVTTMTRDGQPFGPIHDVALSGGFGDFRVDTFSITSFSDTGDDWSSVLAKGAVDNLSVSVSLPVTTVAGELRDGAWEVRFASRAGWNYVLERTRDWDGWTPVAGPVSGTGAELTLRDQTPPPGRAFYQVRAER